MHKGVQDVSDLDFTFVVTYFTNIKIFQQVIASAVIKNQLPVARQQPMHQVLPYSRVLSAAINSPP